MNKQMWGNAATQRNVSQLLADGIQVLGPASGMQACGEEGMGRMLEAGELAAEIVTFLNNATLVRPQQRALDGVKSADHCRANL